MKSRYIAVICVFSIVINIISVNNLLLIMSSLFLLLLVFISSLFARIATRARKVKESDRTMVGRNLAGYGSEGITRSMNRFAIIFSLIAIYLMGTASFLLQFSIGQFFLADGLNGGVQVLSGLGWILFVISLALVTVHVFQLMKSKIF